MGSTLAKAEKTVFLPNNLHTVTQNICAGLLLQAEGNTTPLVTSTGELYSLSLLLLLPLALLVLLLPLLLLLLSC